MKNQLKLVLMALSFSVTTPILAMTVTGPITANSVSVSGSVTFSSMTVSSLTVTNQFLVTGSTKGFTGSVVQMRFVTSIATFTVAGDIIYHAVPGLQKSITLENANNYVRISLSGIIFTNSADICSCILTIKRSDGTTIVDLGNTVTNTGLVDAEGGGNTLYVPIGITIVDSPGGVGPYSYQAYIHVTDSHGSFGGLSSRAVQYLILEEIRP
jgi:hypothetical protein